MSATPETIGPHGFGLFDEVASSLDARTIEILDRRRKTATVRRRGWLIRRALLLADLLGLAVAFLLVRLVLTPESSVGHLEYLAFGLALPGWIVLAKLYGLYDRDEERTDHTTVDEVVGVFHLVTVGACAWALAGWGLGLSDPNPGAFLPLWALSLGLLILGRSLARGVCHKTLTYLQNTLIVGAGDIGQLVARKVLQHPEYGINLVGFVDGDPKSRKAGLEHLALLGAPDQLPALVRMFDIERVVVAFSNDSHDEIVNMVRALKDHQVQIDIVPRLFEVVGPNVAIHTVEGLPLVGLPPAKLSRSWRLIKRSIDFLGAALGLLLTAPLLLAVAVLIKRDSPGPVFFRQTRLGQGMREFTFFKFRTMKVGTDEAAHRDYIKTVMDTDAMPNTNGLFKLSREDSITRVGRLLRKTSLDELPQLINVLRGDMSLVGPRPCIPYETEHFEPHHFERFLVPAGLTGLWQVTGRAQTTFREALDMDVAYARGWSLGLDVTLVLRTVRQLLTRRTTA